MASLKSSPYVDFASPESWPPNELSHQENAIRVITTLADFLKTGARPIAMLLITC